jgi:hypothetical protein
MMLHARHANHAAIETRIAAALAMPAWLTGLVLAISLTTIGLGLHALNGVDLIIGTDVASPHMAAQTHVTILCSTLLAYGLAASRWVTESVKPHETMTGRDWRNSRLAGGVGVIVGLAVIAVTIRQMGIQEPERNPWSLGELYVDLLSLLLLWGIGRAVYFTIRGTGATEHADVVVDLWDMTPLYRYGSQGLRTALAWSGGISLFVMIMFFDPNPGLQVDSIKLLGSVMIVSVATAAMSFFRPLWTLRKLIRQEKSVATDAINTRLHAIRQNDARGIIAVAGAEGDLLARRSFVMSIPEWPIDTTTLRKLGFYALFPAMSWLLGPLLRQVVNDFFFAQVGRNVIRLLH